MNLDNYLNKMAKMQRCLLKFIDAENDKEAKFQQLITIIKDEKIIDGKYELKSLLHLIFKISNNYHHSNNFYSKIEQVLSLYKNQIQEFFSNANIFNIFKNNKRILLFLFEEKIILFDQFIFKKISNTKYKTSYYYEYFLPEIKQFLNDNKIIDNIPDGFYEKRKIGQNDQYICDLIRNDSVKEFIIYVNKTNFQLSSTIEPSIYETNSFLIKKKKQTLIEYAAFFGSIQIIQYLKNNGVDLTPSLWLYAVHSGNADLIHLLEENKIKKENDSIDAIFIESIKCHHNKFVNYFQNIYQVKIQRYIPYILKYHNFEFIQIENINNESFYDLCKNDYTNLVQHLLPSINDINKITSSTTQYNEKLMSGTQGKPIKYSIQQKTPLIIAVEKENVEIVELLLSVKNIDVNIYWKSKYDCLSNVNIKSILHIAVENENVEIVRLLLSNPKIRVNRLYKLIIPCEKNYVIKKSALHIAVENENIEIVDLLLNVNNIDVNQYNERWELDRTNLKEKKTALYIAVEKRNIDIIDRLCLDDDIDMDIPYKQSRSSIEQRKLPRRVNICKKTPLQLASEMNEKTMLQTLNKNYHRISLKFKILEYSRNE